MKFFTWIIAVLFFLGAAGTTFIVVDSMTLAPVEEQPMAAPAAKEKGRQVDDVRKAFSEIEALLTRQEEEVAIRTRKCLGEELKRVIEERGTSEQARASSPPRIAEQLKTLRAGAKLDILFLVTQEDDVIAAEGNLFERPPSEAEAIARATVVLAAESAFRTGKETSGFDTLPASIAARAEATPGTDAQAAAAPRPPVFAAACVPVWVRPDAPAAVLVGGLSIESLSKVVAGFLSGTGSTLRWHFAADPGKGPASVTAGEGKGKRIRNGFYQGVLKDGTTEEPAFDGAEADAPGRWQALKARDGRVVGAWGLTAPPLPPAVVAAPTPPSPLERVRIALGPWAYWVSAATVLMGVGLIILLARSRRRSDEEWPVRAAPGDLARKPVIPSLPSVPASPSKDLVSQFEISWKTFASYTQDLLHQKLQELEEAPQRGVGEVREQVTRLSEALVEIKKDLAAARSEAKDSSHGVVEKVASLVAEGTQDKKAGAVENEVLLKRIEGDFERADSRFTQLDDTVKRLAEMLGPKKDEEVAERVADEVKKLEAQWNERVAAFAAEIEAAKKEGQAMVEDLASAREVEASLRKELATAADRQEDLEGTLEEKSKEADLAAKDRDTAWRRERELIEEVGAVKRREEAALDKALRLEATIRNLEKAIEDGRAREEVLQLEVEEARASEEKHREAIKEIYREEGRFQKDLEQKERDFAAERERLAAQLRGLESRETGFQTRLGELTEERDRLGDQVGAREKDLDAARRMIESLQVERSRLEAEARRANEEAEAARALERSFDHDRLGALEEENGRLKDERAALEREVQTARRDLAAGVQALEARRTEMDERAAAAARAQSEAVGLRVQLEERSADVQRTRKASLEREAELSHAKEALEKALQASLAEAKRLREEKEAAPRFEESMAVREALEKDVTAARAEVERLEKACKEGDRRLRASDEERLRSKATLAENEAAWHVRLASLETRVSEAERRAADAERKRQDAESAAKGLSSRLDEAKSSSRAADEIGQRMKTLEREKGELTATLDRLGKDLERARAEAEGVRRFQGVLVDGSIPSALVAVDAGLKVFAWNPKAEELFGRAASDALGKFLTEIEIKGIGGDAVETARRALRERRTVNGRQSTWPDEKGQARHARLSCDPILGPEDEALGAVLVIEDVTEKVEKEIEARVQSIFNQSLTRSLPAALVLLDQQGRVISWNRNAESLFCIEERRALGEDFFKLDTPLAKEAFRRRFDEARRDRATHRLRVRFEVKGVAAQYVVTQAPFLGADDGVRGTILLVQEAVDTAEAKK